MSKGRRAPGVVIVNPPPIPSNGYRRAMQYDESFFRTHPNITTFDRAYIPGEADPDWPAGTVVHVMRDGYHRVRGFEPPKMEGQN